MPLFAPPADSLKSTVPVDTPLPPNRSARSHCWAARDAFFACLDEHGIVDSIGGGKEGNAGKEEAERRCGKQDAGLRRDCAASWVTYFKQRRVMEYKRKETLEKLKAEGAKPMSEGLTPPRV